MLLERGHVRLPPLLGGVVRPGHGDRVHVLGVAARDDVALRGAVPRGLVYGRARRFVPGEGGGLEDDLGGGRERRQPQDAERAVGQRVQREVVREPRRQQVPLGDLRVDDRGELQVRVHRVHPLVLRGAVRLGVHEREGAVPGHRQDLRLRARAHRAAVPEVLPALRDLRRRHPERQPEERERARGGRWVRGRGRRQRWRGRVHQQRPGPLRLLLDPRDARPREPVPLRPRLLALRRRVRHRLRPLVRRRQDPRPLVAQHVREVRRVQELHVLRQDLLLRRPQREPEDRERAPRQRGFQGERGSVGLFLSLHCLVFFYHQGKKTCLGHV